MDWWKGVDVDVEGKKVHVHIILDALNNMAVVPKRPADVNLRMPVSAVLAIKGVGDVICGRVEQGRVVHPGDEVVFLPTHTQSVSCAGKVFSVEMHQKNMSRPIR